ncbi:hypothetical protein D9O50_00075 [Oxalobacteraceae bacterium CAVE-383]|nr:hypothetical protein D9O50_00075 [Oxalobacteraceae bacterium CAVE-383]
MKKLLLSLVLGLLAIGAAGTASARGHFHGGIYIGGPVWGPGWGPGYYPPSYYYPPAPVYVTPVQPAAPPVYVEQSKDDYWYYCAQPKAYYPYVKECPQGWMRVVPGDGPGPR